MNIIILRWFWVEIKYIFFRIIREIRNILKWSFLDYLKNLLIGKKKKFIFVFLRIFLFLFIFRLVLDILKIIFHFYYIIMLWFFSNLKFLLRFYIFYDIEFYFTIINFFQYIFLFTPFVKLNARLKKTKRKLYIYIIERSIYYTVRVIWWRPRLRRKIAIPVEAFEFLIIYFGVIPSTFFVIIVFTPILDFIAHIYDNLIKWRVFFSIIYYVKQYNEIAGVNYLRHGASLFHIALMLQRQGFEVPKANVSDKSKARYEYKQYRKIYKKAELTPEDLNDKALDIYVFLLDLFKDTRYELRHLPIKDFFLIMFPYEILYKLFCFSYYLYIGLIYLLCIIFFPIAIIHIILSVFYEILKRIEVVHFIFFRDLDDLAREKEEIWTQIRENSMKKNEKKWYDNVRIIWNKYKEELK